MSDSTQRSHETDGPRAGIPMWLGACLLAGIALFFLWEEHEAHILGALPYLLFLACPIIHLLMHRGHGRGHGMHGGHGHHGGGDIAPEGRQRASEEGKRP